MKWLGKYLARFLSSVCSLMALVTIAALLFGVQYRESNAATAIGHASANVVNDLFSAKCDALSFGTIAAGSGQGKVWVTPRNKRFKTGRVKLGKATYSRSTCAVKGQAFRFYKVKHPDSVTFTVQPEGGAINPALDGALEVDHIQVVSRSFPLGIPLGLFNRSGEDTIYLGGRLNVPANAHPGLYRGLVPITLHY